MPRQTIENRVEALELRVTKLDEEGGRIPSLESQIVQFRIEVHDEFSAVRTEMRDGFAAVRSEMREEFAAVRSEMREEFAAVRSEMGGEFAAVRTEIRAGDEETRRFMRVLHEDLVGRIATIQKG